MPVWRCAFSFHGTQYSTDFGSCLIPNNQQRDVSCSTQVKIDLPVGKYMSFTMTTESSTSENERWITEDFWTGKSAHQQSVPFCMSNRCSNNRLPCVQTKAGNSYTKELSSNICKAHAWSRLFINLCDIFVIDFLVAGIICDFQTILTRIGNEKHLVPCEHHENEPTSEQLLHQFLCLVSALDKMASFMRFTISQSPENKNKNHQKHSMYFMNHTYHRACCQ